MSALHFATCNDSHTHRVVVLNFTDNFQANCASACHDHALCGLHTLPISAQKFFNARPSGRPFYCLWPDAACREDENRERHYRPVFERDMSSGLRADGTMNRCDRADEESMRWGDKSVVWDQCLVLEIAVVCDDGTGCGDWWPCMSKT